MVSAPPRRSLEVFFEIRSGVLSVGLPTWPRSLIHLLLSLYLELAAMFQIASMSSAGTDDVLKVTSPAWLVHKLACPIA